MAVSDDTGPYVQAATLCEKVLVERDGVLSVIRMVDRLTISPVGPDLPSRMPTTVTKLAVLVSLKSGNVQGSFEIVLQPRSPSGGTLQPLAFPVYLEGGDRGVNIFGDVDLTLEEEGLYWFEVLFGEERRVLTRFPLRVIYQPVRTGAGPSGHSS